MAEWSCICREASNAAECAISRQSSNVTTGPLRHFALFKPRFVVGSAFRPPRPNVSRHRPCPGSATRPGCFPDVSRRREQDSVPDAILVGSSCTSQLSPRPLSAHEVEELATSNSSLSARAHAGAAWLAGPSGSLSSAS